MYSSVACNVRHGAPCSYQSTHTLIVVRTSVVRSGFPCEGGPSGSEEIWRLLMPYVQSTTKQHGAHRVRLVASVKSSDNSTPIQKLTTRVHTSQPRRCSQLLEVHNARRRAMEFSRCGCFSHCLFDVAVHVTPRVVDHSGIPPAVAHDAG